jgi:hypothetical protein
VDVSATNFSAPASFKGGNDMIRFPKSGGKTRNHWYNAYLLVFIFYMLFPLIILCLAKDQWLDWYVLGCPFSVGAIVCFFFASNLISSVGGAEVILLAVYYFPLLICMLSGVFAMHGRLRWRFAPFTLLVIDAICNIIFLPEHIAGLAIDITLIVFLMQAVKCKKEKCSVTTSA